MYLRPNQHILTTNSSKTNTWAAALRIKLLTIYVLQTFSFGHSKTACPITHVTCIVSFQNTLPCSWEMYSFCSLNALSLFKISFKCRFTTFLGLLSYAPVTLPVWAALDGYLAELLQLACLQCLHRQCCCSGTAVAEVPAAVSTLFPQLKASNLLIYGAMQGSSITQRSPAKISQ